MEAIGFILLFIVLVFIAIDLAKIGSELSAIRELLERREKRADSQKGPAQGGHEQQGNLADGGPAADQADEEQS